MNFYVNDTSAYHREDLETLGWELTVCNCLEPEDSPCRKILNPSGSFGELLIPMLEKIIDPGSVKNFIEIGGGYGYLTRDILRAYPRARATMLDISPFLLEKQRDTLRGLKAEFYLMDFFDIKNSFLRTFDLAIFNENMGDFPSACGLTPEILKKGDNITAGEAAELIERYSLDIPSEPFAFNLGAVKAVSRVCESGIPAAWFSEHSCEALPPARFEKFIDTGSTGYPEKIGLKGHDEYTIKFSHLEKTAEAHGCKVHRGSYLDFISPVDSPLLNFILTSGSTKDEHEIIRQFVGDLCKYEYVVVVK